MASNILLDVKVLIKIRQKILAINEIAFPYSSHIAVLLKKFGIWSRKSEECFIYDMHYF